jgi:hypothetical protein
LLFFTFQAEHEGEAGHGVGEGAVVVVVSQHVLWYSDTEDTCMVAVDVRVEVHEPSLQVLVDTDFSVLLVPQVLLLLELA